jgi:hypothetical protein
LFLLGFEPRTVQLVAYSRNLTLPYLTQRPWKIVPWIAGRTALSLLKVTVLSSVFWPFNSEGYRLEITSSVVTQFNEKTERECRDVHWSGDS